MPNKKTILSIISLFIIILINVVSSDDSEDIIVQENASTTTIESTTTTVINNKDIQEDSVLVIRVIDGDTIELEGGQKVRYIGIDTPETVDPRKPIQCFGIEASNKNKELVEGKKIRMEKDVSEVDQFERLLRYVYIGDIFVNDYLVRQGYAYAYTYPPDVKYSEQFVQVQNEARENSRGLWAECDVKE